VTSHPFRRVLTAAATAPLLLVATAVPAHAEPSALCPESTSIRAVTVDDGAGGVVDKVWISQPSTGEVDVCFVVDGTFLGGEAVLRTGLSGSVVPTVTPVLNDPACPVYRHVTDPVDVVVRLAAALADPDYVCFGLGSTAVGVTVTSVSPSSQLSAQLWIDKHTLAGEAWCTYVEPGAYECGGSAIRVL
jgi:hypothetical protein